MTAPDDSGVDEQDRDHTEEMMAAAIVGLLAARAATAPWLDLVQSSLSGVITAYLQRAAMTQAAAAGLSGGEAAQAASDAVTAVLGDVERHTAAWLKKSAEDRAPKAGAPMGRDDAEQAARIIATSLATYARERVREHVAEALGAKYKTWITRGDDRVREAHRFLAGKTKRIGKPFSVNGSDIMRPGDPEAPPDLVIGCRCHLAYSEKPV